MPTTSKIMLGYGLVLAACGVLGWAAAGFTAKAKTAILSGAVTGAAMVAMAFLSSSQGALASAGHWGGRVLPVLFLGVFSWRASIAWKAHLAGQPKLYVAVLLTGMALASVLVAACLWRAPAAAAPARP